MPGRHSNFHFPEGDQTGVPGSSWAGVNAENPKLLGFKRCDTGRLPAPYRPLLYCKILEY
jgi:hypothetical protein